MKVIRSVAEIAAWRAALSPGQRVAMVPTMGYLHDGHLALMREGRRSVPPEAGALVATIFVNPTQFAPGEDLEVYPRDEGGDLEKCESVGADVVFCPSDPAELFPSDACTWVYVDRLQEVLCGRSRPTHFRGVCTVCAKLWNILRPDVSIFGQKDFQQLTILRAMHRDLHLSGEIVGAPTVREEDGLAMSSRNANLSAQARSQASAVPRFLGRVRERFEAGERRVLALIEGAEDALAPARVDYVEVLDATDLGTVARVERPAVCAVAVYLGGVRLIDNAVLDPG